MIKLQPLKMLGHLLLMFMATQLTAQIELDFSERPHDIVICGADSLSSFRLDITQNRNAQVFVQLRLPPGVLYELSSLNNVNFNNLSLVEFDVSDRNQPVFVSSGNSYQNGDFVEFTILRNGGCDAIDFVDNGGFARDSISVNFGATQVDSFSSNYNINFASFAISYVDPNSQTVNTIPETVSRQFQIANGGTGYAAEFEHRVILGADLQDYELKFNGQVITPYYSNLDTVLYRFDLSAEPFASVGVGDNGNTFLENGEILIFEECFTVDGCDFSDGTIQHRTYLNCYDQSCQWSNTINGNVNLQLISPSLSSMIDTLDNIVCMDGVDQGVLRLKVWNNGNGAGIVDRIDFNVNGPLTALSIADVVMVDENDMDISSYFPVQSGNLDPSLGCGSNYTSYQYRPDPNANNPYILQPDDTIYVEMRYVLCCPTGCGPASLSNPSMSVSAVNLCLSNRTTTGSNVGSGGSAFVSDPLIDGPPAMGDGEVATFCLNYLNFEFFTIIPPDSSALGFLLEIPDGLSYVPSTFNLSYDGNNIAVLSEELSMDGDSLLVKISMADMNFPMNNYAPLLICFDLEASCVPAGEATAQMSIGQFTSIHCDSDCFIQLQCLTRDIILPVCGDGEGDCEDGGGTIVDYQVQRTSLGLQDANNDRDASTMNPADSSQVNLIRVIVGDTIRHQSTLAFIDGTNTSWIGGTYAETYTNNRSQALCPDTAWVVIENINSGNTYNIGGLTPTTTANGFEYDLSIANLSVLSMGALPPTYQFSSNDTLYLRTKYVFCKENASEWFTINPGTVDPPNDYEEVFIAANFEATTSSGDSYGCGGANGELEFLGSALSVEIRNTGLSGNGCSRNFRYLVEVRQNIGGVVSGETATYDFFPNEIRRIYIPDSLVIAKQPNSSYVNSYLETVQLNNASLTENTYNELTVKYENMDEIVFDLTSYDGGPIPIEEENVHYRYFVEFDRNCATGRTLRTDLSVAYTTLLCPDDEFVTEETDFPTQNNSDLGNITFTRNPAIQTASNANTCFDLGIRPRGGTLNYTWLDFTRLNNIEIVSVSVGGLVINPESNGLYYLGSHTGNQTKTVTICANVTSCEVSDFDVLFGWDCLSYPEEESYFDECDYEIVTFGVEQVQSEVMLDLVDQPGRDPNSGNYPDLCEQLEYGLEINSANAGSVVNPKLEVLLPTGFEIDYFEVEYPNGSNAEVIAHTLSGNVATVNLYEHSELEHDSIPGLNTTLNAPARQVFVRMYARTTCDFRSGSEIFFTVRGERPCGAPVKGDGIIVGSDRLKINGLSPYVADPEIFIKSENGLSCSIVEELEVEFVVQEGDFIGLDSTKIYLPADVLLVDSLIVCESPESEDCPIVDLVAPNPDGLGGNIIYLSYPNVIESGDTVRFYFRVLSTANPDCGDRVTVGVENFVTVTGLECDGEPCPNSLQGITGYAEEEIEIVKPTMTISAFTANSVNGTPYVNVTGSLLLDDRPMIASDSLHVEIYCSDASQNPIGIAVDTVMLTGPANIGNTLDFYTSFAQACDLENGLVAVVRPINFCLCTEVAGHYEVMAEDRTFDLALAKRYRYEGPVAYGDTVTFDITVTNQGDVDAYAYEVVDSIPAGLQYVDDNDADGWVFDNVNKAYKPMSIPLLVGRDTTISILLKVLRVPGLEVYDNYAEISVAENEFELEDVDSQPDSTIYNDYGAIPEGMTDNEIDGDGKDPGVPNGEDDPNFDEDDHDVARLSVVDLALIKVIDTLNSDYPWQFGSVIAFDIYIENQGVVSSDSVLIRDYVPDGFEYNHLLPQNVAEGWRADSTVMLKKRLNYNDRDTVTLYLTLVPVADPDENSWINYAEIAAVYDINGDEIGGDDYDSQPDSDTPEERMVRPEDPGDNDFDSEGINDVGSEDDHDPAGVMFLDLALYKQVDSMYTTFPVAYGDLIKFDITVINQDGIMVDSVRVKDYVPEGYHFDYMIPENQSMGWQADTTVVINGPLNVGDEVTTSIYLTLLPNNNPTSKTWVNYAEISAAWMGDMEVGDMDIDSQPGSDVDQEREVYPGQPGDDDVESIDRDGEGSEDDHDPAYVEVFDLALKKTTEEKVAYPGLEALFEITVYNQGGIPATNITISDYIPTGYTFHMGLNNGWTGSDPLVTYTITDTLFPNEEIVIPIILTVTEDLDPNHLINRAEISNAQDTFFVDRMDIDGIFDQDPENDAGGLIDSPADNYVDGDGTGAIDSGSAPGDEDNEDPAKLLPCPTVNCHGDLSIAFGFDCEVEITPDMLIIDNLLATLRPDLYEIELFYEDQFPIEGNILTPQHVGKKITARIRFLLEACGGGSCETNIRLEKPDGCLITQTLDTTVYCIDPFMNIDPLSAAYPKPQVVRPCTGGKVSLELGPDWVNADFDCDSDTAKIIYREWYATSASGAFCKAFDTIVVMRLPQLLPSSFVGDHEKNIYCTLNGSVQDVGVQTRFVAWKQPIGLHDYELPYHKLKGVVYELPTQVIELYLNKAENLDLTAAYLNSVILIKQNGQKITVGQILTGQYLNQWLAQATVDQKNYGILQLIKDHAISPSEINGYEFYPYLVLEIGDQVLSSEGIMEKVTLDWFYNGNGQAPYWMSGGWPDVYGGGALTNYCDGFGEGFSDCIGVILPRLTDNGYDGSQCDTLCLAEGIHCGIVMENEYVNWDGGCTQTQEYTRHIYQTCWAGSDEANSAMEECSTGNIDLVDSYQQRRSRLEITLLQTAVLKDTLPPIFDFTYPLGQLYEGCTNDNIETQNWNKEEIEAAILAGEQYPLARAYEYCNPTVYKTDDHECGAKIWLPSVEVIDQCSGVSHVKASVLTPGGIRTITMVRTDTTWRKMDNGDSCIVFTYQHLGQPISVPFEGCDGAIREVRYEAVDSCWNTSSWTKFIKIVDESAPTIVTDDALEVSIQSEITWVAAEDIDEGSWDNCAISMVLGRRSDWWISSGLSQDPSDGQEFSTLKNWIDVLTYLGFEKSDVQAAYNGHVQDPSVVNNNFDITQLSKLLKNSKVLEEYYKNLIWLWEDEYDCGALIVHAWIFNMARWAAVDRQVTDLHGNPLSLDELERLFDYLFGQSGYGKELKYLGGGWTNRVPYLCEDVCSVVETEFMALDACCNWSKSWLDINVVDKRRAKVQSYLGDINLSCEAYSIWYSDLFQSIGQGGQPNTEEAATLDSLFGGYAVVRIDSEGKTYHLDGTAVQVNDLTYGYQNLQCNRTDSVQVILEEGHDGLPLYDTIVISDLRLDTTLHQGQEGIIVVNCNGSVRQDVWFNLNDCNQGEIIRRFYISNGCDTEEAEFVLEQKIWVTPTCELQLEMFDLPSSVGEVEAPLCFSEPLTTKNFPDSLGKVQLKSEFYNTICNSIAIAKKVTPYEIVNYPNLVKYAVNWQLKDWCSDSSEDQLSYVQWVIAYKEADCGMEVVDSTATITGSFQTELGTFVEDVSVKIQLNKTEQLILPRVATGAYQVEVPAHTEVKIIPEKNRDFGSGINTQDLILIQRHIMGKESLSTQYGTLAADVNGNGQIEIQDILELRRNVLNPFTEFKNNTSWRFVDPMTEKEWFENQVDTGVHYLDFIGVKIGDVDMSGDPASPSRSTQGEIDLVLNNQFLESGKYYTINITSDQFKSLRGLQFALEYLPGALQIVDLNRGALEVLPENYLHVKPGLLAMSWHTDNSVSITTDKVLFTMTVRAKQDVFLNDVLHLNSRWISNEAYDNHGRAKTLKLAYTPLKEGQFRLYQNKPNPFTGTTLIGFEVPKYSEIELVVFDISGKAVFSQSGEYAPGYHEVEIRQEQLVKPGVYYYQIKAGDFQATRPMIYIK